jgi:hypothetical protein
MKALKIVALSACIFAGTGFGLKEWGVFQLCANWQLNTLAQKQAEITQGSLTQLYAKQAQEAEETQRQWRVNRPDPRWDSNGHFR